MENLAKVNQIIDEFAQSIISPTPIKKGTKLYTGIDLGTAYIVLAVADEEGNPVAGATRFAQVVKDGLVVDYLGAIGIVREFKNKIEEALGVELQLGGVAFPPGTEEGDRQAIKNVAESAGFEITANVDECSAANKVLGIRNGAVIDIGGGTTGVAVFKEGELVHVGDEPTGGTHFNLVISGACKVSFDEAEVMKQDPEKQKELFPIVKPVMQKVASIINRHIQGHNVEAIYLAGGTSTYAGIEKVISDETGVPTLKPQKPSLVTPLGIALSVPKS